MNPIEVPADEFRRLAVRATKLAREYLENFDGQPIAPATTGVETLRQFLRATTRSFASISRAPVRPRT